MTSEPTESRLPVLGLGQATDAVSWWRPDGTAFMDRALDCVGSPGGPGAQRGFSPHGPLTSDMNSFWGQECGLLKV